MRIGVKARVVPKVKLNMINICQMKREVFVISKIAYSSFWKQSVLGSLIVLCITFFLHDFIVENAQLNVFVDFLVFVVIFFVLHTMYFLPVLRFHLKTKKHVQLLTVLLQLDMLFYLTYLL